MNVSYKFNPNPHSHPYSHPKIKMKKLFHISKIAKKKIPKEKEFPNFLFFHFPIYVWMYIMRDCTMPRSFFVLKINV